MFRSADTNNVEKGDIIIDSIAQDGNNTVEHDYIDMYADYCSFLIVLLFFIIMVSYYSCIWMISFVDYVFISKFSGS